MGGRSRTHGKGDGSLQVQRKSARLAAQPKANDLETRAPLVSKRRNPETGTEAPKAKRKKGSATVSNGKVWFAFYRANLGSNDADASIQENCDRASLSTEKNIVRDGTPRNGSSSKVRGFRSLLRESN